MRGEALAFIDHTLLHRHVGARRVLPPIGVTGSEAQTRILLPLLLPLTSTERRAQPDGQVIPWS